MMCPFISTRYGNLYLKLAKNSMEKGTDYAKNEIQRLERMLEKVIHYIFHVQYLEYISN